MDFTFVCPTELHAFQEELKEFEKRSCTVIGCSVDSPYSHQAWLHTPKSKGGIQGVEYPLVSDITKSIARSYGVLNNESGVSFRGQFLIDQKGIVRHSLVNDLSIGRSTDEALRLLEALIFTDTHGGEVCPANWHEGEKAMTPDECGLENYFKSS